MKQLWVWPILAGIMLGAIGWLMRGAVEDALQNDLRGGLQAVLDAQATAVQMWLKGQEQTAASIANDDDVEDAVSELLDQAYNAEPGALIQSPAMKSLRRELAPVLESYGFRGFAIADRSGRVVASDRDDAIGLTVADEFGGGELEGLFAGETHIALPRKSRLVLPDKSGRMTAGLPIMFAVAEVREGDEVIALMGLPIDPLKEFNRIMQDVQVGKTGETYAFNRDGLLISMSRFDDQLRQIGLLTEDADSILNITLRDPGVDLTSVAKRPESRSKQPLTMAVAEAIAGNQGVNVDGFRDYRGVPVIGAWRWLEKYQMGMAAKIDVSEAFQPLMIIRTAFWTMFGLLGAASVAIFLFTVALARLNREARHSAIEAKRLGQYVLEDKLGQGGMGVVYRAHHAMMQRPTAVKFLDVDRTTDQAIARFEREVDLTSQLVHPNTIAIYDFGRTPEGIFYYAMEYLEGLTLEGLVDEYGPQPEGRVVSILRQVCGSLQEAHSIGLIHRDIKPANIMLTNRGGMADFVKLLDFGLVKAVDQDRLKTLTSAGCVTGTPHYMSPEAVTGENVDARSDLYAVGAVGFFLLTGTALFDGANIIDILKHHATTEPDTPSMRLGRVIDGQLERVLMRCLAKRPDKRPQTAKELAAELLACQVGQPWTTALAEEWWLGHPAGNAVAKSPPDTAEPSTYRNDGETLIRDVI